MLDFFLKAMNKLQNPRSGQFSRIGYLAVLGLMYLGLTSALRAQNSSAWTLNADSAWLTTTNWNPNTAAPNAVGHFVHLNQDINPNRVITLNAAITVGQMILGDLGSNQTYTIAPGTGGSLIFNMGDSGAGNSFLNKFQGGFDVIQSPVAIQGVLHTRITGGQRIILSGALQGSGTLTSYGDGTLEITADNSSSTNTLSIWNRGTGNVNNNPQVLLNAATGNAVGGNIILGNANFGTSGHAVLQLNQGRTNLDQIKDTSIITTQGVTNRWSYFKLMGGNETIGGFVDAGASAVIENMESETVNTNAILTISGATNSYIMAYMRDRSGGTGTGTLGLTKGGTGSLLLSGGNINYTGPTTLSGGRLELFDANAFNSNISTSAGTTLAITRTANSVLNFARSITGAGNLFVEARGGASSQINLQANSNSFGTVTLKSGTLTFSGTTTTISNGIILAGESAINRILNINNTGSVTAGGITATGRFGNVGSAINVNASFPVTGAINLSHIAMNITGNGSIGSPTNITLSGRPVGTAGGTSVGELTINNSGNNNSNRIGDATTFTSNGGSINYVGASGATENIGQLTLNSGELRIISAANGILAFGSTLQRTAASGATISFVGNLGSGTAQVRFGTAPTLTNGMIGGWATAGNRFATYGANGVAQVATTTELNTANWTATGNYLITGGNTAAIAASVNRVANSLVIDDTAAARTLTFGTNSTNTLTSGGIISNGNNHIITSGTLIATSHQFAVTVNSNQLTLNSVIANNGATPTSFIKSGDGLLITNTSHSYTGKTYINNGIYRIGDDLHLGAVPAAVTPEHLVLNGGTLQISSTGSVALSSRRGIGVGAAGGRIEVGSVNPTSNVTTLEVTTLAPINAQGTLELAVRGANNFFNKLIIGDNSSANFFGGGIRTEGSYQGISEIRGDNTINGVYHEAGTLILTGNNTINNDVAITEGTMQLLGSNTFSGNVTLFGGTIKLGAANSLGSSPLRLIMNSGVVSILNNATVTIGDILTPAASGTRPVINAGGTGASTVVFDLAVARTYTGALQDDTTGLGGYLNLIKRGDGKLTLNNASTSIASTFSGDIRIEGGVLSATSIANVGLISALGVAFSNAASALTIDGGALELVPIGVNVTNRSFTIGANGATLNSSGANQGDYVVFGKYDPLPGGESSPDVAFEGLGARLFTLGGINNGDNQFNLKLTDNGASPTSLLKIGSGLWQITRSNTYSGLTTIQEGVLTATVDGAFGTGAQGVNILGGLLELRNVNYTTAENIYLEGGGVRSIGTNSWAGNLKVNVNSNLTITPGSTLTLTGNLQGNRGITQLGEGTLVLKGTAEVGPAGNDDNRRYYTVQTGTLVLDYTSSNTSKLIDNATLTLGGGRRGGTIRLVGGSHVEATSNVLTSATSGVSLQAGANQIIRESGTSSIRLGLVARGVGSSIYFEDMTNNFVTSLATISNRNTNNIIGAWAIIRDTGAGNPLEMDFARNATNSDNGQVVPNSVYNANTWGPTANNTIISSSPRPASTQAWTVRFANAVSTTTTFNGTNNVIRTGGILVSPTVGRFDNIFTGSGTLTTENQGNLQNFLIHQYNTDGAFVINNPIIDRGVVTKPTATLLSGSDLRRIRFASNADMYVGMPISGPGIAAGSTITYIDPNGTDVQISTTHAADNSVISNVELTSVTGIEKLGPGALSLTGANTFTGVTFIGEGTLRITKLTNGGVAGSLGMASNAVGNLVFNGGGVLQYTGENATTDRGFTFTDLARLNIGHERTTAIFSGTISGADKVEKLGPGTLSLTGVANDITAWTVSEGRVKMQLVDTQPATAGLQQNRFTNGNNLATLELRGGALEVRGAPEGDSTAFFGGRLTVGTGSSEVRAVSVYDPVGALPRNTTINLQTVEEVASVIREAGGTVKFVEYAESGAGGARIALLLPFQERQTILPWAVYANAEDVNAGRVNQFAIVDTLTSNITFADAAFLHKIGTNYENPNNWIASDDVSESAIFAFNGTLSANRSARTIRFYGANNSTITVAAGTRLRLEAGAILQAFDVRSGIKQILGPGTISGNASVTGGGKDLIVHNYNPATPLTIGASVVDDAVTVTSGFNLGLNLTQGSTLVTFQSGSNTQFYELQVGMEITGAGIPAGARIVSINSNDTTLTISVPADQTLVGSSANFSSTTNFVQSGVGTTILSGSNTYKGSTYVNGGVLRLNSANAIPGGISTSGGLSAIQVKDGVIGLGIDNFTRALGTGPDKIQFTGSGGFAAYGADRTVNFGGAGAQLVYGVGGFVPDGSSFILGSHDSTHKTTLINSIYLGAISQVVRTEQGSAAVDGELSGVLSGAGQLIKLGLGTLRVSGANTHAGGVNIAEGTLVAAAANNSLGTGIIQMGTSATNTLSGARLGLTVEGGTRFNLMEVGNANNTGITNVEFAASGALNGDTTLARNVFIRSVTGATASFGGIVTGAGGVVLTGGGRTAFSNTANTFGSGAASTHATAINGGIRVRNGTLVANGSNSLGASTIELGDAVPAVITVDRAVTGRSIAVMAGRFDSDHNGTFDNAGGPGAYVEVSSTLDGVTYTAADSGKRILIQNEEGNPERNGIYEIVFAIGQTAGTMNLVRSSVMDTDAEFAYGTQVQVNNGSLAGQSFFVATGPGTMNTTAVHFNQDTVNANLAVLAGAANITLTNAIDINATNGTGSVTIGGDTTVTSGTVNYSGGVVLQNLRAGVQEAKTLTVTSSISTGQGVIFSGLISEAAGGTGPTDDVLSLFKTGAGVVTLTQANSYHGPTTVSQGTLLVNNSTGSGTGTGAVSVQTGTTLGGNGIIQGPTTLTGAFLSPGDPTVNAGIGRLTFNQSLTLSGSSEVVFSLSGNGLNDSISAGSLFVDSSTVFRVLLEGGYTPSPAHSFNLLDWTTLIGGGDTNWVDNLVLPVGYAWDTTLFNSTGVISIVPEPSKLMLLAVGLGMIALRRRRRSITA